MAGVAPVKKHGNRTIDGSVELSFLLTLLLRRKISMNHFLIGEENGTDEDELRIAFRKRVGVNVRYLRMKKNLSQQTLAQEA